MRLVDALLLGVALSLAGSSLHASPQSAREARRDASLQPERVMEAVGVQSGMVIGEAGAGHGYFTFKLARRVGPTGRVLANDIDAEALAEIERRCRAEHVQNIRTVRGEVDDPRFPEKLDMAVLVYAIHDFARPAAFLERLHGYLRPGATVVVLDQDPERGGESGHFLTRARLLELFAQGGFELTREETFLAQDLVLVFRPAAASQ